MKTLIDNSDYKMNFKKIYGIDFDAFIKDFDDFINE